MENSEQDFFESAQKELENYKELLTKAMRTLGEKISEVENGDKAKEESAG